MQTQTNIIECYNKTANNYADKFIHELEHKHLDRILLRSFAMENMSRGKCIDLGCGPGQTTKYLFNCGLRELIAVDISPVMIEVAKRLNPSLHFDTADMLELKYADNSFGSAIAFYSIVHFDDDQLKKSIKEINRILSVKGQLLFSFHVGNGKVHHDHFLDHDVDIDFYFFETNKIIDLLKETGFTIVDVIEREPYAGIEYPSKRAYVWVEKGDG
ncbi:MAG: methyltransferase domain-containing protein [Ferruginibacter sp.]